MRAAVAVGRRGRGARGVGVALAVVVLAGCGGGGGRSDEEKVSASSRLARLTPPSDLDRIYRDTLASLNGLGGALRRESDAVARHDLAGVRRAVARFQPLDFRKSAGFARLGLPACGQL